MSEFPNTDNVQVAAIYTALSVSSMGMYDGFTDLLTHFLKAYQAIMIAAETEDPRSIDVTEIMEKAK